MRPTPSAPLAPHLRSARAGSLLVATLLLASSPWPGAAATINWNNAAGGAANTAGNWSPATVPLVGDVAAFGLNAGYNVNWTSPLDTLVAINTTGGRSRHNFGSPMRMWSSGFFNAESTTVLSGTVRGSNWYIGYNAPSNFLATSRAIVEARDTLGTSTFGLSSTSRATFQGGARFSTQGAVEMAFSAGSVCTLTVIGFSGVPRTNSGIITQSALGPAARGDLSVGVNGVAQLRLTNGGFASIAGDLILARTVNGKGHVTLVNTPTGAANPSLTVKGVTRVGVPDAQLTGTGTLEVTNGVATLQGPMYLTSGTVTVRNGALLTVRSLEMQQSQYAGATYRVIGPTTVSTIDSTITNDAQYPSLINAAVVVDSGATLHVNGAGTHTIGPSAQLLVLNGSRLDSPGEFAVRGASSLDDATLTASRFRMRDTGGDWCALDLYGNTRVRARVLLDPGSYAWVNSGTATLGDSLADDGFVNLGGISVGDRTLVLYDRNGADLGSLYFASPAGTLRLPQGGTTPAGQYLYGPLRIEGVYRNQGTLYAGNGVVQLAGTMTQDGGKTLAPGYLDILAGARLRARDSVNAQLRVYGTVETGDRPARLIAGNGYFVNSPSAVTRLRIGQADTLAVSGGASLQGTLELRTWGPAPAIGSVHRIITASSVTGAFSNVTVNGVPAAGLVTVTYEPTAVKVTVVGNITVSVDEPVAHDAAEPRFAPTGGLRSPALALELPVAAHVRVALFDVMGRQLAVLADGARPAGRHLIAVPNDRLPDGVYFARALVTAEERMQTLGTRFVRLR